MAKSTQFFVLALATLLVFSSMASATDVKTFCPDKNGKPDDYCIASHAETVEQCNLIATSSAKSMCMRNLVDKISDCSELPGETGAATDLRKDCTIHQAYRNSRGNPGACGTLDMAYEKDCYLYFIGTANPGNPDACDAVPAGYVTSCQKQAFRHVMGLSPDAAKCSQFSPKYLEVCKQAVEEQKQFIGLAGGILAVFFAFLLSPIICPIIMLVLIAIAAVFYMRWQDKNRPKNPAQP